MDEDDLQPDDLDGPAPTDPAGVDPERDLEPVVPPVDPDDGRLDLPELPDIEVPDLPDLPDGPDRDDPPRLDHPIDLPDDLDPNPPSHADGGGAVDLELDQPLAPAVPGQSSDGDLVPGDIDLSLDPDHDLDGRDAGGADEPDVVDLPLIADDLVPFEVSDGNAWLSNGLIAAALLAIGAAVPALARLRRATPPELAAHLDALGIDARVEHLDLTGLEELLRADHTVLLSTDGSAGVDVSAVIELREIDRSAGRLHVVDDRGGRSIVEIERFEAAWSDSAHQVVLAAGATDAVALVPVVLRPADLATT